MIITRTPVRVSFLGGGTDYPSWFTKHTGLVVGGAINKYSFVTARHLPPFHSFKHRIVYREIETVNDIKDIQHKAVQSCIKCVNWRGSGLEIAHLADLPSRSGTGSSSTFVVGLLNALAGMQSRLLLPHELTQKAIEIEQKWLNETVGCQDQTFAAHGGLNVIRFRTSGEIVVQPLPLDATQVRDLESHLMLFFTKQARTSSEIAASYAPTIAEREQEQFGMMRLAEDGIQAVCRADWRRLGDLIDQAWRIKSRMSDKVTNATINDIYMRARLAGAWGGKLTGAGGGGCILLVVPPEKRPKVLQAIEKDVVHIPFSFDFSGSSIVYADKDNLNEYRA